MSANALYVNTELPKQSRGQLRRSDCAQKNFGGGGLPPAKVEKQGCVRNGYAIASRVNITMRSRNLTSNLSSGWIFIRTHRVWRVESSIASCSELYFPLSESKRNCCSRVQKVQDSAGNQEQASGKSHEGRRTTEKRALFPPPFFFYLLTVFISVLVHRICHD